MTFFSLVPCHCPCASNVFFVLPQPNNLLQHTPLKAAIFARSLIGVELIIKVQWLVFLELLLIPYKMLPRELKIFYMSFLGMSTS